MRIVIACDKFRDALSADEAAEAIAAGIIDACAGASIDRCPVADGGEGFAEAMLRARGGRWITRCVAGPLSEMKVDARFAVLTDQTAVIDMAAAAGLSLVPAALRDPMAATTFGVGELILAARGEGCQRIIVGLGGSATIDGGVGCCHATGHTVLTDDGEPVPLSEPMCGRDVARVVMIKRHRGEGSDGLEIIAAVDTRAVLAGDHGAARLYGSQKGATPADIETLDHALASLAIRSGKQSEADLPGAGAAGGLGFGLAAFYGATIMLGIDLMLDAADFDARLADADLCITGEGSLDATSLTGKAVAGVAARCRRAGVPCVAIAGRVAVDAQSLAAAGLTATFALADGPMTLDTSLARAGDLLTRAARNAVQLFVAGRLVR